MQTTLTPDQIATYRQHGFLAIPNFLTPAELAHWRQCTEEAVTARLQRPGWSDLNNQASDDEYYKQVFIQCLKLADTHPGMRQIMHDPNLGRLAATLAGLSGIRIWHDQALIKPAFGNPTGWHLDNPYWSFSSRQSISIWISLDGATFQNGCMFYVPGSQAIADYRNVPISEKIGALFEVYPEFLKRGTRGVELPPGGAAFHNGLTAHGAGANMTTSPRSAMTCAYMPVGSTFNGQANILPRAYFDSLKIGDVLDNEELNPLVYARPGSNGPVGKS